MSAALVPGRIRLNAPKSCLAASSNSWAAIEPVEPPIVGDLGPIWTSGKGGGLGRRGEREGETGSATAAMTVESRCSCNQLSM